MTYASLTHQCLLPAAQSCISSGRHLLPQDYPLSRLRPCCSELRLRKSCLSQAEVVLTRLSKASQRQCSRQTGSKKIAPFGRPPILDLIDLWTTEIECDIRRSHFSPAPRRASKGRPIGLAAH